MVQHRTFIKDSLILCDWAWPMLISPFEDRSPPYAGDTSLESKLYSSATGIDMSEDGLYKAGERIYNLARAVMVKEMGTRDMRNTHDTFPDHIFENHNPATNSPPVDRKKFEALKTTYYHLREWDESTGLPTRKKLENLGLHKVASGLEELRLL